MPQVTKDPVTKATHITILDLFLETMGKIDSKKELDFFMKELLTPTEHVMISKKIVVACLLEKKLNYQEIMEKV